MASNKALVGTLRSVASCAPQLQRLVVWRFPSLITEKQSMSSRLRLIASVCLVVGGVLGMVGSFASPAVRGIAWGLDGTALVVGAALLMVHYITLRNEQLAAGFLVFVAGQTLVVSGSAMGLSQSSPSFAAGVGLWAAALALISASSAIAVFVRITAGIASVLFAITSLQIYGGTALTPLSEPLPFYAYPVLVITLFGLAWIHFRSTSSNAA